MLVMESFSWEFLDKSNNGFNYKQDKGNHYLLCIIVRVRIIKEAEKNKNQAF